MKSHKQIQLDAIQMLLQGCVSTLERAQEWHEEANGHPHIYIDLAYENALLALSGVSDEAQELANEN